MIVAVRVTLPVNPPAGVTVIVEVLPDVDPAATVAAVPAMVKVGGAGTVIVTDPEAL